LNGWLHSWDLSTGVDGPGTRLVFFLPGCPMRCLYCQNPDTWHRRDGTETPWTRCRIGSAATSRSSGAPEEA